MSLEKAGLIIITLLIWLVAECWAQNYPRWFINQLEVDCAKTAVGLALPSFFPDSSVARALRNGYENYVRQSATQITGGQTFWSTEAGTYWMGSTFEEQFDATAVSRHAASLTPLDTLMSGNLVAVLLAQSNCRLEDSLRQVRALKSLFAPTWIEELPQDRNFYYTMGVAPGYFYEMSSWNEAEQIARLNLARSVYVDIKALQKMGAQVQEVRNEEVAVVLQNIQVVSRWRDVEKKVFYVLMRMKK